jgi:hypothetical protein
LDKTKVLEENKDSIFYHIIRTLFSYCTIIYIFNKSIKYFVIAHSNKKIDIGYLKNSFFLTSRLNAYKKIRNSLNKGYFLKG